MCWRSRWNLPGTDIALSVTRTEMILHRRFSSTMLSTTSWSRRCRSGQPVMNFNPLTPVATHAARSSTQLLTFEVETHRVCRLNRAFKLPLCASVHPSSRIKLKPISRYCTELLPQYGMSIGCIIHLRIIASFVAAISYIIWSIVSKWYITYFEIGRIGIKFNYYNSFCILY